MGCTSSTESAAVISSSKNGEKTLSSTGVPSTLDSRHDNGVEKRAGAAAATTTTTKSPASTPTTLLELGKFRIRYACLSRKGRDPEDASKPNQDSYSIHHKFCNEKSDAFFGVYDGHGPTGHGCSGFVKQRLPTLVSEKIKQQDEFILTTDQIHASLREAYTQCNDELHDSTHIDDSSSGTTAITIYIQGTMERITISNVGDSRAVLGTKNTVGGNKAVLRAVPLSKDQTPHRTDEAQRCIQSGARILSFGQINPVSDDDSETEDPPRVWAQDGKYPGTAFTRSIGDSVAERLGVYAVPEMLSLRISPKELIIVLASDGIFDVMSNQQVIDMCYQHYDQDPSQACKDVIDYSHNEWLKAEECSDENDPKASYDDMTMTCIFICHEGDKAELEGLPASTTPATDDITSTNGPPEPGAKSSPQQQRRKRIRQKTLHNLDDM
jgi:serine/threonine protein phosphatase PrpC